MLLAFVLCPAVLRGELLVSAPLRLRAPQQHSGVVADPPLHSVPTLLAGNRQLIGNWQTNILGRSWSDLRALARREILDLSRSYLGNTEQGPRPGNADSIIMAGHQPELFHPGVWVKNFALSAIAARESAAAVNLVVDNDTVKSTTLRFPVMAEREGDKTRLAAVSFDQWASETPYEERVVHDEELFRNLPREVRLLTGNWSFTPFLDMFWQEVMKQAERTRLLGERLAASRRTFERRWGCRNLEAPVSLVCRTEAFSWFAAHLLLNLHEFHSIYNECLHRHRRANGIRSRNHPVPDLAAEDDWRELPLWSWRAGQNARRRLYARAGGERIELRSGQEVWPGLDRPPLGKEMELARAWQDLERHGFKVRSRALTNTLFARCFVADLFIHGIGGGKYDELTDAIAQRFYRVKPPGYLVLSATLLLPLPVYPARPENCRSLKHQARDLRYNPDRHFSQELASDQAIRKLLVKKAEWVQHRPASAAERRKRFEMIRASTEQLLPFVQHESERVRAEIERCSLELDANALLQKRDYAFCFYPEAMLREFCVQFLR
jgi:hypothetical protein